MMPLPSFGTLYVAGILLPTVLKRQFQVTRQNEAEIGIYLVGRSCSAIFAEDGHCQAETAALISFTTCKAVRHLNLERLARICHQAPCETLPNTTTGTIVRGFTT